MVLCHQVLVYRIMPLCTGPCPCVQDHVLEYRKNRSPSLHYAWADVELHGRRTSRRFVTHVWTIPITRETSSEKRNPTAGAQLFGADECLTKRAFQESYCRLYYTFVSMLDVKLPHGRLGEFHVSGKLLGSYREELRT